jgi:hypothetical protein
MTQYQLTVQAIADLFGIWSFIAETALPPPTGLRKPSFVLVNCSRSRRSPDALGET